MKTSAMWTLWYCILLDVHDPVQVLSLTCLLICSFKVLSTLPQPLCGMDVVSIILPENPAEGTDIDVLRSFLEDEPPPLILEHDDGLEVPVVLKGGALASSKSVNTPEVKPVVLKAEHQSRGSIHLHMSWTQNPIPEWGQSTSTYIRNQISGDEKPEQS